jgi:anti-sigma regulatory factor (Ser/Thr protein kinase)
MDSTAHISYNAADRSYFAILKKDIRQMVLQAGFSETKAGKVDIVVAELASNLVKHAGGGELLARIVTIDNQQSVELISIDNGPGMLDPERMLEDGMSTTNTLGQGLGAIKRLSDTFELYSLRNWGTIILSRIHKSDKAKAAKRSVAELRSLVVAKPGEQLSGDGAYWREHNKYLTLFLGDGLGHGPEAHAAVQQAISSLDAHEVQESPVELLRSLHADVKRTRGLVGTLALYSVKEKTWHICGIGNIATRMQHAQLSKNYLSYNGIIGLNIPGTLKDQVVPHQHGQILVMCSDGIKSRWELQKYTGIFKYDLSVLAAAIYKDYARKTDDMSVLIARINTKS